MSKVPKHFTQFLERWPGVGNAYNALGDMVAESGSLDAKTRSLIKLGFSVGCRLESAVKSHARKAREAGASHEEIIHAVMMGMTTVGFPTTMAGLKWVESALED